MESMSTYCTTETSCRVQTHGLKMIKIINVYGFPDIEDDIFVLLEWDGNQNVGNIKNLVQCIEMSGFDDINKGHYIIIRLGPVEENIIDVNAEANQANSDGSFVSNIQGIENIQDGLYCFMPFSWLKKESTETEDALRNIDQHIPKCDDVQDEIGQVRNENIKILSITNVPQINSGFYIALKVDDNKKLQFQNTENFSFSVMITNVPGLDDGYYLILRLREKVKQQVINAPSENMGVQNAAQEIPIFHDVGSPEILTFNYVNFIENFKNFHKLEGYYFKEIKSLFRLQNYQITSKKLRRFLYKGVKKNKIIKISGERVKYKPNTMIHH